MDEYLASYYAKLKERCGYVTEGDLVEKLSIIEQRLKSGLVIAHSTTIDALPSILEEGLLPAIARGHNTSNSALFEIDYQFGLNQYIFASAGILPPYYSKQKRVTLLLNNDVLLNPGSFFTWHDLAGVVHFSQNDFSDYAKRVRKFYFQGRFPASSLFKVLAHTMYYEYGEEWLDKFLEKGYPVAFEPDFEHKNGGNPEIKLARIVHPEKFGRFVIYSKKHLESLENLGIDRNSILIAPDDLTVKEERKWLWSLGS